MDYSIRYVNNEQVEITYDDNTIIKGEYDIIGFYNVSCSIWVWGYASPIERDYIGLSEKIRDLKSADVNVYMNINEEERYYIDNECFFVSYNTIDTLLDFIKKITKKDTIVCNLIKKDNVIEYIIMKNKNLIKNNNDI